MRADDVAEARQAFDLLRQYARVDDDRVLDLFAPDVSVTVVDAPAKGPARDIVLPASEFLSLIRQGLARRQTDHGTYQDLKFTQGGNTVKLAGTRVDDRTGYAAPFLVIYGKDDAGRLKIKAMKLTRPPDTLPGLPKATP